mmetsp:Transcript_33872/g.79011  ORF Transcript_33872/g.79011 Transcript_33872/m.79011 type:complete len:141 (-) Transcript_33872:749-1171(-)
MSGIIRRLKLIEENGMPRMRIVRHSDIERLGRIPRSTEGIAVDAIEEVRKHGTDFSGHQEQAPVIFFSYRWERPNFCEALGKDLVWGTPEREAAMKEGHTVGDPDGEGREKAKALIEWGRWLKRWREEIQPAQTPRHCHV